MAKLIDTDRLSRFLSKIRTEMSNKVLDTMEQILANTTTKNIAGAKGVKEIYNKLNSDFETHKVKDFTNLSQIGLTSSATTDNILDALVARAPSRLTMPAFRPDYPNLLYGHQNTRHLYVVEVIVSNYIKITDFDVTTGITYFCGHDGTAYRGWSKTSL